MPKAELSAGGVYTILPNVSYALPPTVVRIQSDTAVEGSLDDSTFAALTGANTTGIETAMRFIRVVSTTVAAIVSVKRL